mmetsp:Transcript_23315/g.69827  ORF Transcript_23315/g.69827 Transcript_23315/m.69827 type:complete len:223 (-) Transcript_23315:113-781(-)
MVVDDRRSQSRTTGLASSPDAVAMCRPSTGFQATSATGLREAASRSSHQGFFWRRSQTMVAPLAEAVARMCDTCEFHATAVTSPACLAAFGGGAGTKTVGASGLSSEATNTSQSAPPDATRCADAACGLNSRPFTAAEWRCTRLTCAWGWPASSFAGSQTSTAPSDMPPAMRPSLRLFSEALVGKADHARDTNRDVVLATPAGLEMGSASPRSRACTSSRAP